MLDEEAAWSVSLTEEGEACRFLYILHRGELMRLLTREGQGHL